MSRFWAHSLLLLFLSYASAQDDNAAADDDSTGQSGSQTGEKKVKTFEPGGALTREYQYIFRQGTMSWDGFDVVSKFDPTKKIGRIDGQTGWTGIN